MVPWVHLDTATMPGGGGELRLMRRGAEFSIMAGPIELMNSRVSGSEEALATLACGRIGDRKARAGADRRAGHGLHPARRAGRPPPRTPASPSPNWCRRSSPGPGGRWRRCSADCLDDPRVGIHVGDVAELLRPGRGRYDAILLDVDNGPEGLTRKANDALYGAAGCAPPTPRCAPAASSRSGRRTRTPPSPSG